jgi:pilus assembly protein Flp/PilA
MISQLCRALTDRRGATAIEYALIASLIAVAAIGGIMSLGTKQSAQWNNVNDQL